MDRAGAPMKNAHGVKFLAKMGLATMVAVALGFVAVVWVAPTIVVLGYFLITGESWEGGGSYLPSAYDLAVNKAVLLREEQWSGDFFPTTYPRSQLCSPAQIPEGRLLASQPANVPCAVAIGYWDRPLCGIRQMDVCAVIDVNPATYDDPGLHARIVRALSSPCDFFSPADGKRQQERIALGCDKGGTARRRVVVRAGVRTDILEFHVERKSRR